MKHSSIRELYEYWNARRGTRPAPERSEIEPAAIRRVLADTLMLAVDPRRGHPFRIAGTRVCAAFGRELKGVAFLDLWTADSQQPVRDLIDIVTGESVAAVAGASGASADGARLELQLLALPLSHRGRTDARLLGALVPNEAPYWLGASTLGRLTLGTIRYLGPDANAAFAPRLVPVTPVGRIRRGLVVYDGGLPE